MNKTVTNVDLGSVVLDSAEFNDELLTFAGADTALEGTVLARDSVSGKLVVWADGGANETDIAKAVLTYEVEAAGAGDVPIRAMVLGKVRQERLIIHADGDGSNVDAVLLDQLRSYGITPVSVTELNILDNQ